MTTWQEIKNWAAKSTRDPNQCQGFVANDFTRAFGSFKHGYNHANEAWNATEKHYGEPPRDRVVFIWYDYPGPYGHVAIGFNGEIIHCSGQGTPINPKGTIRVLPWGKYGYKMRGWSYSNGVNTIPQLPTPAVNPYGAQGVRMGGAAVNRRQSPTTSSKVLDARAAGQWIKADGYTDEGQNVNGTTRWFRDVIGGWYSASVSAAENVAGLTRLNPDGTAWTAPTPPAPAIVYREVTFDWNDDDEVTTNSVEKVIDGKTASTPPIPTRSGYEFAGWALGPDGATPFDPSAPVVSDFTVYGVWVPVEEPEEPTKDDTPEEPAEQEDTTMPDTEIPAEPEQPTVDEPEPAEPARPAFVAITPEQIAAFLRTGETAGLEKPAAPIISDKVAKPLWVTISLIVVSAGPVASIATMMGLIDAEPAQQLATNIVGWAGSIAGVLGLSRYAKTTS